MERRATHNPRLWIAALALLGVAAAACALPAPARAEEGNFARLYYSSWMTGRVTQSPADPTGTYEGGETLTGNFRTGLEVIFLQRLGLSYDRYKLSRAFQGQPSTVAGCLAPGCMVTEESIEQSINLAVYAWEVSHNSFNLFFGGGSGFADYGYKVDGVLQTQTEVTDNMSLARWFWGLEYVFERMGFRLEFSRMNASKSLPGLPKAELAENRTHLTFVIPLN